MAISKPGHTFAIAFAVCLVGIVVPTSDAQRNRMPRADVVDVPAIGEGLCVHNLFQSNMVLQRDKPIVVRGWADPDERIIVAFAGTSTNTTASRDRTWRIELPAMPANSEPSVMTIKGADETLTLDNILLGDVWLLGGQSNMEFPLSKVDNGHLEIISARFDEMRILTVPFGNRPDEKQGFARLHEWSDWFGRHFRKGDWDVCSPAVVRELSAIGYVFARRLHMATGVPIGIIDVSRGGTTVETWTPDAVLRDIETAEVDALLTDWDERVSTWDAEKDLTERVRRFARRVADRKKRGDDIPADWKKPTELTPGPAYDANRPGNCYAGMIAPIAGLAVKGAIFHQGFNNALGSGSAGAAMYRAIFSRMITAWRTAFGNPNMPFGIVSLCTEGPAQTDDNYVEMMFNDGIYIREAQYETFLDFHRAGDRNVGFASSYDMRRAWYHPQRKLPVGERISRWALATQYGMGNVRWHPPMLTEMQVEKGRIVLRLDRPVAAAGPDATIVGFAIAGEDRQFQPAQANWLVTGKNRRGRPRHDRRALVLASPHVPKPMHFRYAWGRNPIGNLQSADHCDLPFATQRSDDWKMEAVPLGVMGDEAISNGKPTRRQRNRIRAVLRQADLERRLAEARTLLEEHGNRRGK